MKTTDKNHSYKFSLAEKRLKQVIIPDLENGRPNFDKPHTLAVVKYIKRICSQTKDPVDDKVLIIAAYAHDWGYTGKFTGNAPKKIQDILGAKKDHMGLGALKLRELLKDDVFSFLTNREKERAIYLVSIHDKLDDLKEKDELILMEADTLGGLDPTVKTQLGFESYLNIVRTRRLPKFITPWAKDECRELLTKREIYYQKLKDSPCN